MKKIVSIYLVSGLCVRLLMEETEADDLEMELMLVDEEIKPVSKLITDSIRVNIAHITHIEISDPEVKEEIVPEIVGD